MTTVGFVHIDEFINGPEGWEIVNSTDMNDEVRKGIKCCQCVLFQNDVSCNWQNPQAFPRTIFLRQKIQKGLKERGRC